MMKQYEAILFDLDGTLLPMDLEVFTKTYLKLLAGRFAPENPEPFIAAVWQGTYAMVNNDGSELNENRFWTAFAAGAGEEVLSRKAEYEDFYRTDFHKARMVCGENPLARSVIDLAHEKAERVILATNPLFPICAVQTRLSWVGLDTKDFDYITTYDNSSFCKPKAEYYRQICAAMDLDPVRCLMVGNDLREDAWASSQVGMASYTVTDSVITRNLKLEDWRHGSFAQLPEAL